MRFKKKCSLLDARKPFKNIATLLAGRSNTPQENPKTSQRNLKTKTGDDSTNDTNINERSQAENSRGKRLLECSSLAQDTSNLLITLTDDIKDCSKDTKEIDEQKLETASKISNVAALSNIRETGREKLKQKKTKLIKTKLIKI